MSEMMKKYIQLLEEARLLGVIMINQEEESGEALHELENMDIHLSIAIDILRKS